METCGGTNNEQIKLLLELYSSGEYKINKDLIDEQRLNLKFNDDFNHEEDLSEDDFPINNRLGNTI